MVMLMDRDQKSFRFWTSEDIRYYSEVLSRLPRDKLSDKLKRFEFSERIFTFPLAEGHFNTATQIRSALERLKGLSNDLYAKAKHIRAGGVPDSICTENLREYKARQNRQEAYRRYFKKGNVTSSRDIKRAKYFCDADVMQRIAIDRQYRCALLTITLPGSMHNKSSSNGVNMDDVISTREGSKYLKRCWKAFKPGSESFGFTVLQLHKNGSPHLHAALFYPPEKEAELRNLFKKRMKKAGAGLSHFSVKDEELSGDGNRAISYLSKGVGDEQNQAAFSRSNGVDVRSIQPFGICLHTSLFNEISRHVSELKDGGAFFQSLHDLMANRNLMVSNKKYKFICDFLPEIDVISESVKSDSGKSRKKIIGIRYKASGEEILWHKKMEPVQDFIGRKEAENDSVNIKITSIQKQDVQLTRFPVSADFKSGRIEVKITCIAHSCVREQVMVFSALFPIIAVTVVSVTRGKGITCEAQRCRHDARIRAPPGINTGAQSNEYFI